MGGETRKNNNYIKGSCMETIDYTQIDKEIFYLNKDIKYILQRIEILTFSDYIDEVVKIHHKLTIIHPFGDGNGRVSRAALNWLFKLKGLPPVYIKTIAKNEYYTALENADKGDYTSLYVVFYKATINSLVQLNNFFVL